MNRYERQIKGLDETQFKHAKAIEDLYDLERKEDRSLTEDERLSVEEHVKAIETLKREKADAEANLKTLQEAEDIGRKLGPAVPSMEVKSNGEPQDRVFQEAQKTLGERFIESKGYKETIRQYREQGGRFSEGMTTGQVDLSAKGTLLEGAGGGGGVLAATVPQVVPGVVDRLFQQLTVADLIGSGQASTNSLRYVVEGTATSGAAGVLEGGTKPESTLGLTTTDEPIRKIATILPVSEEMLEDAPAVQSYINSRLVLFVKIEEERQLLRGTGAAEVTGLLNGRGVPVYAGGTAAGNRAEQLFKAMNGMRGSAFVEADWVIINPSDWEAIRLLKDTAGQFYGGGPFMGQYGNNGMVGASGQAGGPIDTIWNKPTYVTGALGSGTAVVGSRSSAQVWRRGGLSVEATNSHSNYFQLNLVAIRAEERLGLAVYRPTGFVEVRLA